MKDEAVNKKQPQLNGKKLLAQLEQLGKIGYESKALGRTRVALTDTEKLGRDLLIKWMNELELDIKIDQVGNILGTLVTDARNNSDDVLMIGSHIDTVINAGALDGCYGVLAGLAVIRAFKDSEIKPKHPITVVAFTNEEGIRYQPDMMGSLAYAGGIDVETVLQTVGIDGTILGEQLERIGYAGETTVGEARPKYYLELHIEQGPVLEAEQLDIGVVSGVQGISWQKISIQGKANHAGTTPMHLRIDAGVAASMIVTFLRDYSKANPTTLTTVGSFTVHPNAINVIPSHAEITVDIRDPNEERLKKAEAALSNFLMQLEVSEGVTVKSEVLARFQPVEFATELVNAVEVATKQTNLRYQRMVSGAGHDAQMIARIAPAAMIFVPSKGGVSHNPAEHTEDEQLLQGAEILLETVKQIMLM